MRYSIAELDAMPLGKQIEMKRGGVWVRRGDAWRPGKAAYSQVPSKFGNYNDCLPLHMLSLRLSKYSFRDPQRIGGAE